MKTIAKVAGYEIRDVLRSRWLIGYALFFLGIWILTQIFVLGTSS